MLTCKYRSSWKLKIKDSFERAAKRQKTEEAVKTNIELAQKKQKEYHDLKNMVLQLASVLVL